MTAPFPSDEAWPESWRLSYCYDRVEIWGALDNPPYTDVYHQRRDRVIAALKSVCPRPACVLDIAAAQGNFTIAAAALGHRLTWNDLRGELADYVRMKAPADARIDYVPGNILDVAPVYARRFDVVMALEVIEHVAHPDAFLRSVAALVKPGGHIIISTPNGGYALNTLPRFFDCPDPSVFEAEQFKPNSDGHIFLLHEDEIRTLAAQAGLEVLRHELFGNSLSSGHLKTRHLHGVLPRAVIRGIEAMTAALPALVCRKVSAASLTILRRQDRGWENGSVPEAGPPGSSE